MEPKFADAQFVASTGEPSAGLSYNDVGMRPAGNLALQVDYPYPNDGVPRPPYDPLTTSQKVHGVFDGFGSIAGGLYGVNKFAEQGRHVLQADLSNLDKLVGSPELQEFRTLGSSLGHRAFELSNQAHNDLIGMQEAKPHLFNSLAPRGVWKGIEIKTPKYNLMNLSEKAVVDRAANFGYLSDSLRRGVNTSNTANFKSGLVNLTGLDKNPAAISDGMATPLRRLQDLGYKVEEQATNSTITIGAESRAILFKNLGIISAGLATNAIMEKTLLKDSAPNVLTIVADCVSPSIVLTELPLWAKFGVIVGTHALTRLAEYGTAKHGSEE
jgi:hypothetical protein